MLIAAIIVFCILLLVLAFVLGVGQRAGSSAPGKLGKWLSKPFSSARRAVSKSGSAGRKGRSKMPV